MILILFIDYKQCTGMKANNSYIEKTKIKKLNNVQLLKA